MYWKLGLRARVLPIRTIKAKPNVEQENDLRKRSLGSRTADTAAVPLQSTRRTTSTWRTRKKPTSQKGTRHKNAYNTPCNMGSEGALENPFDMDDRRMNRVSCTFDPGYLCTPRHRAEAALWCWKTPPRVHVFMWFARVFEFQCRQHGRMSENKEAGALLLYFLAGASAKTSDNTVSRQRVK